MKKNQADYSGISTAGSKIQITFNPNIS